MLAHAYSHNDRRVYCFHRLPTLSVQKEGEIRDACVHQERGSSTRLVYRPAAAAWTLTLPWRRPHERMEQCVPEKVRVVKEVCPIFDLQRSAARMMKTCVEISCENTGHPIGKIASSIISTF